MTRKEQILEEADKYFEKINPDADFNIEEEFDAFVNGAEWSDKNPSITHQVMSAELGQEFKNLLERCKKSEQQLAMAVQALFTITQRDYRSNDSPIQYAATLITIAKEALAKLKELKDN